MSRHVTWLHTQIKTWVQEGVIDDSTAHVLTSRYPQTSGSSWGVSLITAIGAAIFGLGVILFFAFNWSELSKTLKLATIFAALLSTHSLAFYLRVRKPQQTNLIEGFHLIGTMMFGAGIWLIAQIYHMDEHYPTAILLWGVGALAFAWVMPSAIQGLLACLLISVWGVMEITDYNRLHLSSVFIIVLGILPLAWHLRSRVLLLFGLISGIGLSLLNTGAHYNVPIVFYLVFSIALLMIAAARVTDKSNFPGSAGVLRSTGVVVYGFCLFLLTLFGEGHITDFGLRAMQSAPKLALTILWITLTITALLWIILFIAGLRNHPFISISRSKSAQHGLILLSLLVLMLQLFGAFDGPIPIINAVSAGDSGLLLNLIYNAILLAHCILLIIRGTDNQKWGQIAIGFITLSILIFARFNDLFHSLLLRSLAFLILGATLFIIGHLYSKRKNQEISKQEDAHA